MKISNADKFLTLLVTLIFLIKPLEFLAVNFGVANFKEDLIYPIIFHLIIFLFFLILFFVSIYFNKSFLKKSMLALATLFYLQYYFLDLSEILNSIAQLSLNRYVYYIASLIFLSLLSIFFAHKFFSSTKKHLYIIFVSIICLLQIGELSYKSIGSLSKIHYKNFNNIGAYENKNNISENVYYIILDSMTSYEYFSYISPNFANDLRVYENILKENKFHVTENSFSSYNTTYLTLGSIFNLNYLNNMVGYKDRTNFFPSMLYNSKPPLISKLENSGYKFFYSGNMWSKCKENSYISCVDDSKNFELKSLKDKLNVYINNSGIQTFYKKSIVGYILRKIFPYDFQDGIDNFLNYGLDNVKKSSKSFYFIHNFSPHPPYFDKNCAIDYTGDWKSKNLTKYSVSVICSMKKVTNFLKEILIHDPNAIFVIQGDHGPGLYYDFAGNPKTMDKNVLRSRFSIFNALRIPVDCKKNLPNSIGNVETINIVFNCISGDDALNISLQSKSYAGFYESHKNFGEFEEVTERLK
jgi:hypothetical protein